MWIKFFAGAGIVALKAAGGVAVLAVAEKVPARQAFFIA